MTLNFSDRLAESARAKGSVLVLGLDPRWDRMPEPLRQRALERFGAGPTAVACALEEFCLELLDSAGPYVCAAKVQAACFEAWGADGYAAYPRVVRAVRERWLPRAVTILHPAGPSGEAIEALAPFVKAQAPLGGRPTGYVCRNFVCSLPVTDPAAFVELLEQR